MKSQVIIQYYYSEQHLRAQEDDSVFSSRLTALGGGLTHTHTQSGAEEKQVKSMLLELTTTCYAEFQP